MKRVLVIDGQGGKIGQEVIKNLLKSGIDIDIVAVGTNNCATLAMIKAGAVNAATGENPVIFNSRNVDYIIGPMGIAMPNSLFGEVTPAMANAVGLSRAKKILIPVNKCGNFIISTENLPLTDMISIAINEISRD